MDRVRKRGSENEREKTVVIIDRLNQEETRERKRNRVTEKEVQRKR